MYGKFAALKMFVLTTFHMSLAKKLVIDRLMRVSKHSGFALVYKQSCMFLLIETSAFRWAKSLSVSSLFNYYQKFSGRKFTHSTIKP